MLVPPLLSPNVILSKKYMTRVFSLDDGTVVHDTDCGDLPPGHCCAFDRRNNIIWSGGLGFVKRVGLCAAVLVVIDT